MGTGSPGSVWVLCVLNTEPDPGSTVGTTPGADHVYNQRVYRGRAGLTSAGPRPPTARPGHGWRRSGSGRLWERRHWGRARLMELTQGTNRVAQLLGSRQGQGTADTGPAVGDSAGAGCGSWWPTARGGSAGARGWWLKGKTHLEM